MNEVDHFINDLNDGEQTFIPEARNAQITTQVKGRFGSTTMKPKADFLTEFGWVVHDYKTSVTPELRWNYAKECYRLIEWARNYNLVIRTGISNRLKTLEEENMQLKRTKADLRQQYLI